jgi:hypothetical protein
MDALKIRVELRRMGRRELLKLITMQKISHCLIGGASCRFHLHYKELTFCASEIMGHSCELERLKKLEEVYHGPELIDRLLPFLRGIEREFILTEKKTAEFKVYYRDHPAQSLVLLGKVMERRRKERGNNLKDLLKKAIMDYSDRVKDPSAVFLLGS